MKELLESRGGVSSVCETSSHGLVFTVEVNTVIIFLFTNVTSPPHLRAHLLHKAKNTRKEVTLREEVTVHAFSTNSPHVTSIYSDVPPPPPSLAPTARRWPNRDPGEVPG